MKFIDKRKSKFYVLDKNEIVNNHRNQLVKIFEEFPEELSSSEEFVIYEGVELLRFPTLTSEGNLVEATHKQLVEKGIIELDSNEFIVGDFIKTPRDYEKPKSLVIPVFNFETKLWEEKATESQKLERLKEDERQFYNDELYFASRANTEYSLGIIDKSIIDEVGVYMKSIHPKDGMVSFAVVKRPTIFDKYSKNRVY